MAAWYQPFERRYKYRTTEEVTYETGWRLLDGQDVQTEMGYVHLSAEGLLTIQRGYAWDGASGPTLDTPSTMLASLVHDALYQLLREGKLQQRWRLSADRLLKRIMLKAYSGNWPKWHAARVECWVWGLKHFAGYAARLG